MERVNVRCDDCNNVQTINKKAASTVTCLVCDNTLAEPRGGNAEIKATVLG